MESIWKRLPGLAACLAAALVIGSVAITSPAASPTRATATSATTPYPGTYTGTLWNTKVKIEVGETLETGVSIPKAMRTTCGKIYAELPNGTPKNGRLALRNQQGSGRMQDNYQTTVYALSGSFTNGGRTFHGTFSYSHSDRARKTHCATQSSLSAKLVHLDVVAPWDAGHYAGTITRVGPIAFDLKYNPTSRHASIDNLTWKVGPLQCLWLYTEPPGQKAMTTRIRLSGPVESSGKFGFHALRDGHTAAWGTVIGGKASGKVQLGQLFEPDGTPHNANQTWFCDDSYRWGGDFTARKVS